MKSTALLKCATIVLLMLVLIGGSVAISGVSAQTGSLDEPTPINGLTEPQSLPVVQVTTDPADDAAPALVQTTDGKLLTVFVRNSELWSRTSADGGATWTDEMRITGCCRFSPSLARVADGTLWLIYDGYGPKDVDLWYRTSTDHGATWSEEAQLTTYPDNDYDPVILQAVDGKLWVVWTSYRNGTGIWYKTSSDGGATWSTDNQLAAGGEAPSAAVTSGGRLVVVYSRGDGALWQRTSSNGGATWTAETRTAGCCRRNSGLAAVGGVLWLAYENDGNIWYRTSVNQGTTWSAEAQSTRFVGSDSRVTLAVLMSDKPGFVWSSDRSGNPDIWFGIPGEREDINPPPYVEWIERRPGCNPDSDDTIIFRARTLDETSVASVDLVWLLNGVAQADLPMFDDGMHDDEEADDIIWGVQHAPLPAGSQVTYSVRATDTDGNTYLYPGQNSFTVLAPFVKTADILFVPDGGGYGTAWRSYYTDALDAQGYEYDIWDPNLRCAPDSTLLNQYTSGAIIWPVPDNGYITGDNDQRAAVQSYLDAGGKLFITGQNIARNLNDSSGRSFLDNYLHATYREDDTGLCALTGIAGNTTGGGLALNICGGDGANNQYSPDEVDPIAPAQVVFTYQAGAMLAEPIRPVGAAPGHSQDADRRPSSDEPGALLQPNAQARPAASATVAPEPTKAPEPTAAPAPPPTPTRAPTASPVNCIGSCTAGLRVDTGTYKVVYFAFGFEAINSASSRAAVMERVLAWLEGRSPRPVQLTPANGQTVAAGAVNFTWLGVPGATHYEIQIDTVSTFDSPGRIDRPVEGTSYSHSFTALGTWYWRVRAQPDNVPPGLWTSLWTLSVAADVVQVTTDPADDTAPALTQTTDGKLLTVYVRNGHLWSRTSTDSGATWGGETQVTNGCCRYNPSLARAADGTLWLAYDRDGDIWYRTSSDQGASWMAETKLPTDPDSTNDFDPVIFQTADGKLWVVWYSYYRADYNHSLWYKTSVNGGATWSADTQLTSHAYDYAPAATVTEDGRVVVVWNRWGSELWQRSSSDGGATWSAEARIVECCRYKPNLTAIGRDLWLINERDGDIWYRISANGGDIWSDEVQFTFFRGGDNAPAAVALASGSVGIAWQSDRSSNPDIWFGIPGERDELNPPPYIEWIEHRPQPNPDSDDPITFRVHALDETAVVSVHAMVQVERAAQPDMIMELPMYDDGTHGDDWAGDGVWSVQHAPLPEGSQVSYRARAIDTNGNSYRYPGLKSFKVLSAFVKTASILFVADAGGNNTPSDTAWFRPYYTQTLEALGYRYDTWDTGLRGEPPGTLLNQYTGGAIIWAVPYWGYATEEGAASISALQAYLDAGGKLFITGQNIAESHNRYGYDSNFLTNYLHATYRQGDAGLYAVVCNGRALNISGGDGANDQYSKDEVDPLGQAEAICTYQAGVNAMLAEPSRPPATAPSGSQGADAQPAVEAPDAPAQADIAAALTGNIGSGTAGLRVATEKYKVVYFAFGFEAINNAVDRTAVMGEVLDWLEVTPMSKVYLPLVFAAHSTTDSFWADDYRLELGECTTLHWSVINVLAVYLNDTGVTGQGARQVCPEQTTPYVLRVERASGTQEYRLTIFVETPTPEPLLVHYDFEGDFTASGTVLDRSGKGHDAQVTGAVASTAGISGGQGIAFNGGYLQAATNPAAGKTDVTFSLWFKTADPTQNYKLASGAWWNWGPGSGWIMATHGPEFWSADGNSLYLPDQPNNENNFAVSEWIHEVVTYDGSRIKEYTNGQLINDWATTGAAIGPGNPMAVGAWPMFSGYNFQGSMDEFAIYGRSLTQQEVQALYQQGR